MNQSKEVFWKKGLCTEKESFPFHTGHKSYSWVMCLLSLPFSVRHFCVTAMSENKPGMFLWCVMSVGVRTSKTGAMVCVCIIQGSVKM